jgi:hypothetical protein
VQLFCAKDKKLLVFGNKFHHDSLYKNCSRCANHKSLFAVLVLLVAIRKSQLVVHKNFSKKPRVKMLMELTPGDKNWQLIYPKWNNNLKFFVR